jgi:hypothetical protein
MIGVEENLLLISFKKSILTYFKQSIFMKVFEGECENTFHISYTSNNQKNISGSATCQCFKPKESGFNANLTDYGRLKVRNEP